jgi:RHS repeat-associated protein
VEHDRLSQQLTIKEPGYVYVYLSNEETSPVDVFFDDFTVEFVKGPVIQQTDYDPFGLTLAEITREHETNNFLYNGKELQKDFDLNWYDYGARMYDAALGRWHVIDPKAGKYYCWSPYNYVLNSPVMFVDPDGKDVKASRAFMASDYGPIFKDLYENNAAYREIISDYEGRNSTLGLAMTQAAYNGALAETESYTEAHHHSTEFYSKSSMTRKWGTVDYHFSKIGLASTIIHEAIHSEMAANGESDDANHNNFNRHHEQIVNALKEYNKEHNLGYTENELDEFAYDGTYESTEFKEHISFMAAKHYNNSLKNEWESYTLRIWNMMYIPAEPKEEDKTK